MPICVLVDNYNENNEDEITYCGEGCYTSHGWGPDALGFHDWGRRADGVTTQQFVCRFAATGALGQCAQPHPHQR